MLPFATKCDFGSITASTTSLSMILYVGEYYWVRLIGSDTAASGGQTKVNAVQENNFISTQQSAQGTGSLSSPTSVCIYLI